jgi:2-polyprenyl-6-methoxyphenol hydroxylase-like FAD-dependent oxidoreductase
MKIKILGAGPAGLYVAILLKRSGFAADLSVVEQSARAIHPNC